MTQKKKILIISISVSLAVALAVIFITLAFTVWKPKIKTTQEWLNDFKTCLVVEKDNSEQKTQKSITILEDGNEVALYNHLVEIKKQNNEVVAHLFIVEQFTTLEINEFDTSSQYNKFSDEIIDKCFSEKSDSIGDI